MLGSHRLGAIIEVATKLHDGSVCMVRWPSVLLKLKLILRLCYIKNMEYTDDRKFIAVYVCQKLL